MTDYREQAIRDVAELATTYYKPHRFGDGPAWYAACVAACRELAQLRARVAILDAQKAELPELDKTKRAWGVLVPTGMLDHLKQRERQLLDALRAVQAWREVARQFVDTLRTPDPKTITWDHDRLTAAIAAYDALAGKGE